MHARIDQKADAIYRTLTDRKIEASEEFVEGIVIDYDAEGRVVGIKILDAAKRCADPAAREKFGSDMAGAA